jgi:lipase ATG15
MIGLIGICLFILHLISDKTTQSEESDQIEYFQLIEVASRSEIRETKFKGATISSIKVNNGYPDIKDSGTIASLAKMSANAYYRRGSPAWYESNEINFKENDESFGWERAGIRGHIFGNSDRSRIIISFKGTSIIIMGGGTVARDRLVDNMMFSCCCARIDLSWSPICDCHKPGKKCIKSCIEEAIKRPETNYFEEALTITQQIMKKYPKAKIWFIGHSMGGALASLLARKFGKSGMAITFGAPGDSLFASRLGLGNEGQITHFGVSTDPVYEGVCRGPMSICYLWGYAMETKCRIGMECKWDFTPIYRHDINTHRMQFLIERVINPWHEGGISSPKCIQSDPNCIDCAEWKFVED